MRTNLQSILMTVAATAICFCAVACGNNVKGHTYAAPGGMVKIEFQSGGKAQTSMGFMSSACTYTQSGSKVELTCEGDTTELTMGSDGTLTGPPDGMLARLSKVQ